MGVFNLLWLKLQRKIYQPAITSSQYGVLEIMHKELDKMCRIYMTTPQHVVKCLRTQNQRLSSGR